MDNEPEVVEPQKNPEPESKPGLSEEEISELRHKAEVSSQNYERAKKAEARLKELETLEVKTVPFEQEEVQQLREEVSHIKGKMAKADLLEDYPAIKENWSDFEKFCSEEDNGGMTLRSAAKAFLMEKGLLEPQRKGLEKPTGGPRTPVSTGLNLEEVRKLRETDYRKYSEMIRKGQIKV